MCVYTRILYVDIDYFNILLEQYWKQRSLNIDSNNLSNEDWDILIKSGIFKNVTELKILGQPPLKVFDKINPNLESLHVEDKNAHPFIHKLLLKSSKLRDLYAKYDNIDLFYKFYQWNTSLDKVSISSGEKLYVIERDRFKNISLDITLYKHLEKLRIIG